jgi:hypothetical protein
MTEEDRQLFMNVQYAVASSDVWSTYDWRNTKVTLLIIYQHLSMEALSPYRLYINIWLERVNMAHFLSASSDVIYNSLTQQSSLLTAVWLILLFDNKVPMKMHSIEYICVISDNVCVRSLCTIQVRVQDHSMLQNKYKYTEVWIITLTCYLPQFDILSSVLFTELIYISMMISSFEGALFNILEYV